MRPLDLQVNGCAGIDFNSDTLTADDFSSACFWMEAQGADAFLPTLITAEEETLKQRLHTLADLVSHNSTTPGIHLEGPFLSGEAGYIGAHPADAVQSATPDKAAEFLEAAQGQIRLVTLAPEQDTGGKTTRYLVDQGVRVAAGHTDASIDQLRACVDQGMTLFTHVGNGCPPLLPRHDNIVQRALCLAGDLRLCFIPDGLHVEFFALRNYLDSAGIENCLMVTDAISAAGGQPGLHPLAGGLVEMGKDGVPRIPDGTQFAGSALGWEKLLLNLEKSLGLSEAEIKTLCDDNPRAAIQGSQA